MFRPAFVSAALGTFLALSSPAAVAAAAGSGTPYQDTSATGAIGFCDKAGHPVTGGSIAAKPFVWRAVSSVAAAAPYNAAGGTATLYAYQPRNGVDPGDWSGAQLTASARYSNPAHPMAAATNGDDSLRAFMSDFAPQWDGLLQLRLFLSAPNQSVDSLSYAATSIKVTGKTWHVVNPVSVPCDSGKATSIESILLPASATNGKTKPTATTLTITKSGHTSAGESSTSTTGATATPTSRRPAASGVMPGSIHAADTASTSTHHGRNVALWIVGAAVLLAGSGAYAYRRPSARRKETS